MDRFNAYFRRDEVFEHSWTLFHLMRRDVYIHMEWEILSDSEKMCRKLMSVYASILILGGLFRYTAWFPASGIAA